MTIHLDHTIVPARNKVAAAKLLAELLGVAWAASGPGPGIKAKGIPYRSTVHGPTDMKVNTDLGGPLVYWNEPEGHFWEMLTVSYARPK